MDHQNYLHGIRKQFRFYKILTEKTLTQLSDQQLVFQFNEQSSSIATLIKHISGNLISRWTNFLTSDGEKPWRKRDQEFVEDFHNRRTLLVHWEKAWELLFQELDNLTKHDLDKKVYIRNQAHTVPDAIHRQLTHVVYHIGQIVHQAKLILEDSWQTLTIPKGQSESFIAAKLKKGKREGHFTDEYFQKE